MATIHDLETPAVVVDLDVLERNIGRMADWAKRHGVRLRPHAKTHKAPAIARLQLAAGASGLSLAKASEAAVFVDLGFDDIFVAYPAVGGDKARRLLALAERARVAVGVDSVEGAASLARTFLEAGRRLDVLLKVDVGYGRVGVAPETAPETARRIAETAGLRLRGVFTHAGHSYFGETPEAVVAIAAAEGRILAETAAAIRSAGLALEEVSVGSTPTAHAVMSSSGITECRPGNYVFHDASQVSLGTCSIGDCALTVLASVVSAPGAGRAFLDAGSKTLSSDPLRPRPGGHGWLLGTRSRLKGLSEEHGWVEVGEGDSFRVGQRVRVLPNHACVVANLHDRLIAVRGERVEGQIEVSARGRIR